jgi:ribosomal protein L7/L12
MCEGSEKMGVKVKTSVLVFAVIVFGMLMMWAVRRRRTRRTVHLDDLPAPSDKVRALALDPKRKIDAIREYRQETGLGLLEAKAIVEALLMGGVASGR